MFESVRADIIAEHFTKEHNAGVLVVVAKELDERAHSADRSNIQTLSIDAKSVLGVFADFVQANRAALLNGSASATAGAKSEHAGPGAESAAEENGSPNRAKLL